MPLTLPGEAFPYDSRMFGRDPESRDFIIAFTATCLIAGGFVAYAHWVLPAAAKPNTRTTTDAAPESAEDFPQPFAAENRGGSSNSRGSPAQFIAAVYECNAENGRVMSDRPCGDDAEVRHIEMPNLMRAHPKANSSRSATPARSTRAGAARAPVEYGASGNDVRCALIDDQTDQINARMRRGYTSREGEYFRERLRELSAQRWEAKCHH